MVGDSFSLFQLQKKTTTINAMSYTCALPAVTNQNVKCEKALSKVVITLESTYENVFYSIMRIKAPLTFLTLISK